MEENQLIQRKDVKNAINGVIKFVAENPRLQNNLFKEEIPLFLQINCFKIPKMKKAGVKELFRIPMAYSPFPLEADICLIVPEIKGVPNKEHEKHIDHYETLLNSKGIKGIKKIMTIHEFRTEYGTFELKRRLADLYDVFLVDGKISGKVVHKCGKIFYKKRKVPISVRLEAPNLKSAIDKALKKSFFHLSFKSDSHMVQIGYSNMKKKELIDNVYSIVQFLEAQFPGKMENIRSLNVFAYRGSSIPIYLSLKNPNEIEIPIISVKKPKYPETAQGELSTKLNSIVNVKPDGTVYLKKIKK